jgi:restriction system protein
MKNVDRGVYVTTSDFYSGAQSDIKATGKSIILINGNDLTELMIKYNIGVSVSHKYEVKRIDTDYFIQ